MSRNIAEYMSYRNSYMEALKAFSEWMQTADERLQAACQGVTEADTDLLMNKLGFFMVSDTTISLFGSH